MTRTVLQKIRDVLLSIMAVMVSVVCALMLYLAYTAGSALSELGRNDPAPAVTENFDPVPTNPAGEECAGEELPPGC